MSDGMVMVQVREGGTVRRDGVAYMPGARLLVAPDEAARLNALGRAVEVSDDDGPAPPARKRRSAKAVATDDAAGPAGADGDAA